MKITIVGAGNIGKLFGALLSDTQQDLTLVDIQEDLVEKIGKEGIIVQTQDGAVKKAKPKITKDAVLLFHV